MGETHHSISPFLALTMGYTHPTYLPGIRHAISAPMHGTASNLAKLTLIALPGSNISP